MSKTTSMKNEEAGNRKFDNVLPDFGGKNILVTGGTGSFGHALTKKIIEGPAPRKLIIYSRDEMKQYEMGQLFQPAQYPFMRYFIGDVRDRDRLEMALRDVDIVIHAAALKHVPAAEYNPFECIHTNVLGAENIVQAAIRNNVTHVVALSTDKAANPVNLYGASKLASDKIFVAANALSGAGGTRFSVVRYGNVVGSRGSVVPFFRKLIDEGTSSLPITDNRMTRFWITLPQGVNFVLSAIAMMRGGEIFVPKIPSMKVTDLAACMGPNLEQEEVGVRPGEKLHEVMITTDDARTTYELDDRYIIAPAFPFWTDIVSVDENEGRPVPDGFFYSSDSNEEWLDHDGLRRMLSEAANA